MNAFLKIITDFYLAEIFILGLGFIGLLIAIERIKSLFFDQSIKVDQFASQVRGLVLSDQIEEAVTYCDANRHSPVAHIIKSVIERADRDEESMRKSLEISFSEVLPKLTKRLGYLAMIANVSTLIGLLGTIIGLIMSFQAVAFAEASEKSELLSQGISTAMNTTALGLTVAIPIMILYAVLHARQNAILNQCSEYSSKILDLLSSRVYRLSESKKQVA